MNADGSIAEFFFNIVPGSLFILLLKHYNIFDVFSFLSLNSEFGKNVSISPVDPGLIVVVGIVVFGLFLGFVFQGITKLARDLFCLNEKMIKNVKKNNKLEYDLIVKELNFKEECSTLKVFYLMDGYLRGDHPAFLPTHFSSRFAFWANIFIATGVLILLRLFLKHTGVDNDNLLLFVVWVFSYDMSRRHFYGYYDSILKSYFMRKEIKYKK